MTAQPILESHAKAEMSRLTQYNQAYSKRSSDGNVDIVYANIHLQPDMNTAEIVKASVKFHFRAKADLLELDFDLRKELIVDSIIYHNDQVIYTHGSNNILNVHFSSTILNGSLDSLCIYYHGMPNIATRAYSRNVNISGPNISTLSQPYGAPYWWPCRDNLIDKIDSIDFVLTVDTPFTAVANGLLKQVVSNGDKKTYYFSHRYPIANYLVAVSFSKYKKYTQTVFLGSVQKQMDIVNYVFPHNDIIETENKTALTIPILRLYDSLFGPYPFNKEQYGHAQFAWGGGMEHQTMSFMVNFNYDLIAHELAHQWFGDKLTCGTWKDIWLNESFATYSNLLCYNFLGSKTDWLDMLKKNQEDVILKPGGAVYASDTSDVNALFEYRTTYQKGAMVLHQLRWLIGDAAFFSAIRQYLSDADLAYGFAKRKDLQTYFEESSGMDLNDYFTDWIMDEGYPQYDIQWQQKGKTLVIESLQTTSMNNGDTFNVPLPLLVNGQHVDTLIRMDIHGLHDVFSIPLDFKVKEIVFDPYRWLIAKASIHFPINENDVLTIYPNPFNGLLYITASEFDIMTWEITDVLGKEISSKTLDEIVPRGGILQIDLSALAAGVYTIRISDAERSITRKLIKYQ